MLSKEVQSLMNRNYCFSDSFVKVLINTAGNSNHCAPDLKKSCLWELLIGPVTIEMSMTRQYTFLM